ncbi:DUF6932 family protein [Clostridium pasteurianum]|uniref:Uncharacterized protein n=1 Tax=Clostridium pasteurianum BC1 TaxID=86416 RepID=R4K4I6_CLOPA|nr:hypothetical protein [Clostridium pasteurianum]AGK96626.1 hypothetical protein Clopa_1704 [Clostridium pasteurianum BC1]
MKFNEFGLLPLGDYHMTIEELRNSILVIGPTGDIPWDVEWRRYLVDRLEILVNQLWKIDISEIYIDGSFVEEKAHPNDIDGYFECNYHDLADGTLQQNLNLLDKYKVWTWDSKSRRSYRGYSKRQLPMWHKYRIELYPHIGQISGIKDEYGNDLQFPAAFRKTRDSYMAKGIVKILKERS